VQLLYGTTSLAMLSLVIGSASLVWTLSHDISRQSISLSLLFSVTFVGLCQPILFFSKARDEIAALSGEAATTAAGIERYCTERQLRRMTTITWFTRVFFMAYFVVASGVVITYGLLPLYRAKLAPELPFLPENSAFFWALYFLQTSIFTAGPLSVSSMICYHFEMSLCISFMFRLTAEHFQAASCPRDVESAIGNHQRLLETSRLFVNLFALSWFNLFALTTAVLIISTCVMITVSFEVILLLMLFTAGAALFMLCFWGELVTLASESVGFSVYNSDWVSGLFHLRKELALVILKSNRPVCVVAGFFGSLGMPKFYTAGKTWYKFVQAVLNLQ